MEGLPRYVLDKCELHAQIFFSSLIVSLHLTQAPEVGTYNDKFGWGLGIEQMGVEPDFEVDNNPRIYYDGKDEQLEYAINFLAQWLQDEPVVLPKSPGPKRDMSLPNEAKNCRST